jgi:hypothetical protein
LPSGGVIFSMLSKQHVRDAHKEADERCRMEGDGLPRAHAIQELVTVWKGHSHDEPAEDWYTRTPFLAIKSPCNKRNRNDNRNPSIPRTLRLLAKYRSC